MYQQWCQGRDDWPFAWPEFVAMAARELNSPQDAVIQELQTYAWFNWQSRS